MATSTLTFFVNATTIDFASISTMEDDAMKYIFLKIEEYGLKGFFDISSQVMLSPTLRSTYENSTVTADGKILLNIDATLLQSMKIISPIFSSSQEKKSLPLQMSLLLIWRRYNFLYLRLTKH